MKYISHHLSSHIYLALFAQQASSTLIREESKPFWLPLRQFVKYAQDKKIRERVTGQSNSLGLLLLNLSVFKHNSKVAALKSLLSLQNSLRELIGNQDEKNLPSVLCGPYGEMNVPASSEVTVRLTELRVVQHIVERCRIVQRKFEVDEESLGIN